MTVTDRWYIKEQVSEITADEARHVIEHAMLGEQMYAGAPPEDWYNAKTFYHVIVGESVKTFTTGMSKSTEVVKFDVEKFGTINFINGLKRMTAFAVAENVSSIGEPAWKSNNLGMHISLLADKVFVTENFYIQTGAAEAGAQILFQTILAYGKGEAQTVKEAEVKAAPTAPAPGLKLKEYNAFEFMRYLNKENTLTLFEKALEKAHAANSFDSLEEKWDISFAGLAAEMKMLHAVLMKKYYDVTFVSETPGNVEVTFGADAARTPAPDAPTVAGKLKYAWEHGTGFGSRGPDMWKMWRERDMIEFGFTFPGETFDADGLSFDVGPMIADHKGLLVASAPPDRRSKVESIIGYIKPETPEQEKTEELGDQEEDDPSPGFFWKNNKTTVMSAASVNEDWSDEIKFLLYKADSIRPYLNGGRAEQLEDFVREFIRPIPQKLPKPKEATKVFKKKEGDAPYKNKRDLQGEILSDKQKSEIHSTVLQKYNQVGDAAFLNILQNNKTITSIEDVYKKVLNVIPLDSIIQTAASCLMKYLPNTNLKELVCDTVLGNINFEDLDKLVAQIQKYMTSPEVKSVFDKILNPTGAVSGALGDKTPSIGAAQKKQIAESIQNKFKNDFVAKDIICEMLFKAIPSATDLLNNMKVGSMKDLSKKLPFSKKDIPNIKNPAQPIFDDIEKSIGKYKGMALTADWSKMIKDAILSIVKEFITQLISKMLEEIAYLCEGSSKSDFANMNTEASGAPVPLSADPPVFPFDPATIKDAVSDPSVYPQLASFAGVPTSLIRDFLDALGKLLTISEICALLDEDSSDVNISYLINKIWNGPLSLEKFAPLKKALGNKGKLRQFFHILSTKTSKKYCVDKLKALENTKKLLSNLCGPPSNDALIEDLKNKASDKAIQRLLDQENDIAKSLLDAMHNIQNIDVPPIFCGPDANSARPPIFPNQQHPSVEYLNKDFMRKILLGIEAVFEKDIGFYKPILTMGGKDADGASDPLKAFLNASSQIKDAMAQLYELKDGDGNNVSNETKPVITDRLNKTVAQGNIVAPKVYSALTQAESSIQVTSATNEGGNFLQIATAGAAIDGSDVLRLNMNFGDEAYAISLTWDLAYEVAPHTSELIFGSANNPKKLANPLNFEGPVASALNSIIAKSYDSTNPYDFAIQVLVTGDLEYYGEVLNQTIKEHAEYIATQDLFTRGVFDTLQINKKDPCDKSLLDFKDIFDDIAENVKILQCKVPMSAIPTVQEICQINAFVELSIKVVIIKEFLRSLMVFSVFGIDSLLSGGSDSFYYKYLMDQILYKLGDNIAGAGGLIEKYSLPIYAAKHDKEVKDVSRSEVALDIISNNMKSVQDAFVKKNKDILVGVGSTGAVQEEFTGVLSGLSPSSFAPKQILQNLINGDQGALFLPPPHVLDIDENNKEFIIPAGYYSNQPRLANGGFFIESGLDVSHKFKGDTGAATKELIDKMNAFSQPITSWEKTLAMKASLLKSLVTGPMKWMFGNVSAPGAPPIHAHKKKFEDLEKKNIVGMANREGKLNSSANGHPEDTLSPGVHYRHILDNFRQYLVDALTAPEGVTFDEFFATLESGEGWLAPLVPVFNELYKELYLASGHGNPFFKKFNYYASLNILIPVTSAVMTLKKHQINNTPLDQASTTGFYKAVLDKKYFLKEEGANGQRYFKLPLIIFHRANDPGKAWTVSPSSDFASNWPLSNIKTSGGAPEDWDMRPHPVTEKLIWDSVIFKDFVDSIQYKELLSFLSILVAEMIEKQYPALQPMFDGTLNAIQAALNTFLNTANRDKDPEFYQKTSFNTEDAANSGRDMNWVPMILEMLVKTIANMSDPTWKTPWFFPGPLTPFGIVAKILDGKGDSESNAAEDASSQIEDKAVQCPDESN